VLVSEYHWRHPTLPRLNPAAWTLSLAPPAVLAAAPWADAEVVVGQPVYLVRRIDGPSPVLHHPPQPPPPPRQPQPATRPPAVTVAPTPILARVAERRKVPLPPGLTDGTVPSEDTPPPMPGPAATPAEPKPTTAGPLFSTTEHWKSVQTNVIAAVDEGQGLVRTSVWPGKGCGMLHARATQATAVGRLRSRPCWSCWGSTPQTTPSACSWVREPIPARPRARQAAMGAQRWV
jgi:hypothetical protein